jgi:hypothetical protein
MDENYEFLIFRVLELIYLERYYYWLFTIIFDKNKG